VKRKALFRLLAYSVHQTIGTIKPEGSQALAAVAEGAKIAQFVFWPTKNHWGIQNRKPPQLGFFGAALDAGELLQNPGKT